MSWSKVGVYAVGVGVSMLENSTSMPEKYIKLCRADFLQVLQENGTTEEETRRIDDRRCDQCPFPPGTGNEVEFKPSQIEGIGVFAARQFKEKDIIAPVLHNLKRTPICRYVNHSPAPNAILFVTSDGRFFLVAIALIRPGQEILTCYRANKRAVIESNAFLCPRN